MKAGAAESRPEWRLMEQMKGDKWRQEQPRAGQNGHHEGGKKKGDK